MADVDELHGLEDSDVEIDDRELQERSQNVLQEAIPQGRKKLKRRLSKVHASPAKAVVAAVASVEADSPPVSAHDSGGDEDAQEDIHLDEENDQAEADDGYADEEDELDEFFSAKAPTAPKKKKRKKADKGKKLIAAPGGKSGPDERKPAQNAHAARSEAASDDEYVGDDEDPAAATQRLLRDEARFEGLGKGFQPEVQPLDSLLSKLAQRRATFDPVGAALVAARTAPAPATSAVLLKSVDVLLSRVVDCVEDDGDLVIDDADDDAAAPTGDDGGVASPTRSGEEDDPAAPTALSGVHAQKSEEEEREERAQRAEEEKQARREKRAEKEKARRNAFELLLQARIGGGGGGVAPPARKGAQPAMPAPVDIARQAAAALASAAPSGDEATACEPVPVVPPSSEAAPDAAAPALVLQLDTQVLEAAMGAPSDAALVEPPSTTLRLSLDTQDPGLPGDANDAGAPSVSGAASPAGAPSSAYGTSASAASKKPSRLTGMAAAPCGASDEPSHLSPQPPAGDPLIPELTGSTGSPGMGAGAVKTIDDTHDSAKDGSAGNGAAAPGVLLNGATAEAAMSVDELGHACIENNGDGAAAKAAVQPEQHVEALEGVRGDAAPGGADQAALEGGAEAARGAADDAAGSEGAGAEGQGLEDSSDEDGSDEDGSDDEDGDEDDDEEGVPSQADRDAQYRELLRLQRLREQGDVPKQKKLRARDYYEAEAEQSDDEAVSEDEESDDGYDEYEGMSPAEIEDMLRELKEKGVNEEEIARAHAAWADDQDAALIKKLKRSIKRGFDKGRTRLGGPGHDDDDGDLDDARARRRALAQADDYEGIDGDTLVREHLKRSLAASAGGGLLHARRPAILQEDDFRRRASEKEAYQKALASKEVCLPDIEDDADDSPGASVWGALFAPGTAQAPPGVGASLFEASEPHVAFGSDDVPSFARIRRGGANVKAASTITSASFVFASEGVSQSGSLSGAAKHANATAKRESKLGAPSGPSAAQDSDPGPGATSFKGLNDILLKRRAEGAGQTSKKRVGMPGVSALASVAASAGAGSSRGALLLDQHLASAVALKKL